MSRLAEFHKIEQRLITLLAEIESIKDDPSLVKKLVFESEVRRLLGELTKRSTDLISILEPHAKVLTNGLSATDEKSCVKNLTADELPGFSWNLPNDVFP